MDGDLFVSLTEDLFCECQFSGPHLAKLTMEVVLTA